MERKGGSLDEREEHENERAQRERWTRANDSKTMQLFAITASVRGSRNYPILFPLLVPPALSSLSLSLPLCFTLPLNYPFSLFTLAPRCQAFVLVYAAVYTYIYVYTCRCHHMPSKHRREKLIDFERRRHANSGRDNAAKSIEFAHRSVNERRNSESSRLPASHAILLFEGITSEVSKSNATLLWIHRRDSVE